MDWRLAALACAVTYGVGTYFFAKANPVHGANISALLQIGAYVILLAVMGFGRDDLHRVTTASFINGAIAAALFVVGSYAVFYAIGVAPAKAAVIDAISASFPVIAGILIHFLVKPMTALQWTGIAVVLVGVTILNLAPSR